MRSALTTTLLLLLAGLVFQPALSGGWRGGPPPHPRMRAPEPRAAPQFQQRYAQPQRPPAYEPQRPGQQMAPPFQPPRPSMSRGDAMRQAQERTGGGRVLGADPTENGYRVRVLKNGEVSTVYVQQ
jgi:hypothetical protein